MIKIFEDEENQQEKSGSNAPAPFSLNLDPVAEDKPEEVTAERTLPEETVREEAPPVEPAPVTGSPWEKIEEGPVPVQREALNEPETIPVSVSAAPAGDPEIPAAPAAISDFVSDPPPEPELFVKVPYQPDTSDETIRNSGLAWSAGIIFFGSVIFMMFLGWGFDLLFGSSPYGLVGGIVFGSLIGFIQFFRISAQIFRK
jgi:hypothetical protein